MIKNVEGDILFTKADAIVHGVAPNDDFKQGLALSLRERWPAMYKDFRHYCKTKHPKEGELWTWQGAEGAAIVNLLTQEGAYDPGTKPGKATIENVNHALKNLRSEIEERGFKSIALTKISTGVGGLDWEDVEPLIVKHLQDLKVEVFVYTTFHAGEKAEE
ncbi:MAG: macro domain-containing protein [Bdellovibrionales bacterium]